jgi:hypothetical protein
MARISMHVYIYPATRGKALRFQIIADVSDPVPVRGRKEATERKRAAEWNDPEYAYRSTRSSRYVSGTKDGVSEGTDLVEVRRDGRVRDW